MRKTMFTSKSVGVVFRNGGLFSPVLFRGTNVGTFWQQSTHFF